MKYTWFFLLIPGVLSCSSESLQSLVKRQNCDQAYTEILSLNPGQTYFQEGRPIQGLLLEYETREGQLEVYSLLRFSRGEWEVLPGCRPQDESPNQCLIPGNRAQLFFASRPTRRVGGRGCGEVDHLSYDLRSVAQCFYQKKSSQGLKKSLSILSQIRFQQSFYSCLGLQERLALDADFEFYTQQKHQSSSY